MKNLLIKVTTIFKPIIGKTRYVSGMGRSTYDLLKAIGRESDIPFTVKLYGSGFTGLHTKAYDLPFRYNSFPLPMKLGTELTNMEAYYLNHINKHDLLHIPHNYDYALAKDMNFVTTIHDTCEYDIVKEKNIKERIDVWNIAAYDSKKIITCSNCSKNDILTRFGVPEEKVVVIPWGIDIDRFNTIPDVDVRKTEEKLCIEGPYFLAVSCANERKNMYNLLKAYRKFAEKGNEKMILLWSTPPERILSEFSNEIAKGRIVFLNYVDDKTLVALYNGATATMYPSRYEGFGFPILESFACGTPVMTCNNSSLSEVGGDIAVYVGEDNIDEMTQAMEMLANSQYDINSFKSAAKQHVLKYSWEKAAKQYIKLYSDLLQEI